MFIKNTTPYVGRLRFKFEKHPHYTGGKSGVLNKVHLNLGFTKLVSRMIPYRNEDKWVINSQATKLITKYTGGKIGTHTFGKDGEDVLANSFLANDGTYIGNIETARSMSGFPSLDITCSAGSCVVMAVSDGTTLEIEVRGRNLAEGVPRAITVTSDEITQAISDPLQSIVSAVKSALEQTPPELSSDIAERGIVLTGGGALLRNLDKLLAQETGLPVVVAEDPLTCVTRGGGKVLEFFDNPNHDMLFVG
jgi:hypothetical protein